MTERFDSGRTLEVRNPRGARTAVVSIIVILLIVILVIVLIILFRRSSGTTTGGGSTVKCTRDTDCTGTQVCNLTSGTCVDCTVDSDCPSSKPICDQGLNKCSRAHHRRSPGEMHFLTSTPNQHGFLAHAIKDGSTNAIYIRHGHDESSGYSHDQRLTEEGWNEAQNLARKLVKRYGEPAAIYYSPFDRTKDTAKAMYAVLKNKAEVKLKIEPRIGKYFTKDQRSDPQVSRATVKRGMIIPSNKGEYEQGMDDHHAEVKERHPGEVVWNITHAVGVNYHLKRIKGKSFKVDFLQHITSRPE